MPLPLAFKRTLHTISEPIISLLLFLYTFGQILNVCIQCCVLYTLYVSVKNKYIMKNIAIWKPILHKADILGGGYLNKYKNCTTLISVPSIPHYRKDQHSAHWHNYINLFEHSFPCIIYNDNRQMPDIHLCAGSHFQLLRLQYEC